MVFAYLNFLVGIIVTLVMAIFAYKKEALSVHGTIGAVAVGAIAYGFGGWQWFLLLGVFFITSMLVSRYKQKKKERATRDFAKGGVRDFWQVMANGAVAMLLAFLYYFYPADPRIFIFYIGVLATVTADTWATELGVVFGKNPFMITTLKKARPGTSGAVSLIGLGSSVIGAIAIGGVAALLAFFHATGVSAVDVLGWKIFAIAIVAGFVGGVADSLLGATVQAGYYCSKDKKFTEKKVHSCGTRTTLVRGVTWMDNDVVNFFSSIAGGAVALWLFYVL
ncbi:MAG TPA: DUF92 domain-containing protein [Candidatus Norongarragalinales archaeon]|nr:DUF92 domain-containing protein [Candidatus Norongarragalinales archaeon]